MLRLLLERESDDLQILSEDTFRAIEGDIFDTCVIIETLEDAKRNGVTITRILESVEKFIKQGVQATIADLDVAKSKSERDIVTKVIRREPG